MIDWETFKSQLQTDPGRMLKSVLLLAGCLFMIWLIVVMQSNPGMQQNVQVQNSGRLDSLRTMKMQSGSGNGLRAAQMPFEDSARVAENKAPGSLEVARKQSGNSLGIDENKSGDNLSVAKSQSGDRLAGAETKSGDSLRVAETQSRDSIKIANTQSADSLGIPGKKFQDSRAIFRHARTDRESTAASDRGNGFSSVFPTVLIFLVLIGGAWYWLRTQKKSDTKHAAGAIFTTIASQQLPGGPVLTVLKLNGEYWVMASGGPQGTQLLHRYASEEWNGLEEIDKQLKKHDWKNTFLKTLNTSFPSANDTKQKRAG